MGVLEEDIYKDIFISLGHSLRIIFTGGENHLTKWNAVVVCRYCHANFEDAIM